MASMPLDGTALWRKRRREKPDGGKRAVEPPDDWWTAERDLLASVVDVLRVLVWQRTKDGHEGRNAPKPIRRPGVRDAAAPARAGRPADAVARLEAMSGRRLRPPA